MSLLGTATSWLVEPADEPLAAGGSEEPRRFAPSGGPRVLARAGEPDTDSPPATGSSPLTRVAVLGPPAAVAPLAAAVALACRARARVPSALVASWSAAGDDGSPPGSSGPALPGAAALAARLSRRGLATTARGRLAWLALPGDHDKAVSTLRHAEAAAGDLPVVLAVARPRDAAVDALLAERELLVVVAPTGSALATAADADVRALRIPVRVCAPLPPGALRLAALAGLRGPRSWPGGNGPETTRTELRSHSEVDSGPAPGEEAW